VRSRILTALLVGAGLSFAAASTLAQPTNQSGGSSGASSGASSGGSGAADQAPPGVPIIHPPEEPGSNSAASDEDEGAKAATNSTRHAAAPTPPPPPIVQKPVRSPAAVIQALDKVTTETMRFAAPVGQAVRYKNLVFMVKACESTNLGSASPQASAYVVIDLAPPPAEGAVTPPPPHQVFKGWMFSHSPGLNPFQHPIYDAWLISCMAAAPPLPPKA